MSETGLKVEWRDVLKGVMLAVVLCVIAFFLYPDAETSGTLFEERFAQLLMQLAVIVIAGALVKAFVDSRSERRRRVTECKEQRVDFLRRVRNVHSEVYYASRLLSANDSALTFSEQLRHLIRLATDIDEIKADLQVARDLFENQAGILAGLTKMHDYLCVSYSVYDDLKRAVDVAWKQIKTEDKSLRQHILEMDRPLPQMKPWTEEQKKRILWTLDLIDQEECRGDFKLVYEAGLTESKGEMRIQVFGPAAVS